jgi:CDP-paratose 2-epimerase
MQNGTYTQSSRSPASASAGDKPVLITGGSGFVGANLAERLLSQGREVVLYDNLARAGVEANAQWLAHQYGSRVKLVVGDVRDAAQVSELVASAGAVYHFAAQVAVTTSLVDPVTDFEVNVRGTLNVLEALRRTGSNAPLIYTSNNKVYGALPDVGLSEFPTRYVPSDAALHGAGIDESRPLDFHSPYGCSKGAADQYVVDYARSFGLRATVFRMSCIYGPRQFGTEDQGWVAHFLIRAAKQQPLTIYGDGKQVRDILFVGDLVDAMQLAEQNIDALRGQAFNIGGGAENVVSLIELVALIATETGRRPELSFEDWRTGDQRYYVSNTARFQQATGWRPKVDVRAGLQALAGWLGQHSQVESPRAHVQADDAVVQPGAAS